MPQEAGRGSEGFADRLVAILNDAMLALMSSVGHRTGFFDVAKHIDGDIFNTYYVATKS